MTCTGYLPCYPRALSKSRARPIDKSPRSAPGTSGTTRRVTNQGETSAARVRAESLAEWGFSLLSAGIIYATRERQLAAVWAASPGGSRSASWLYRERAAATRLGIAGFICARVLSPGIPIDRERSACATHALYIHVHIDIAERQSGHLGASRCNPDPLEVPEGNAARAPRTIRPHCISPSNGPRRTLICASGKISIVVVARPMPAASYILCFFFGFADFRMFAVKR